MAVIKSIYSRILANFPQDMEFVFAYGSAVFQQMGHVDKSKNMLDFIFAVNNPLKWHQENIQRNPSHYSFLRHFGAKRVSKIQEKYGAHVYFNTLVPCEDRLIKYGVISTHRLVADLLDWDTLYVSGRLHKPVRILREPNLDKLHTALSINRQSALHAALLLLPDTFTEVELYTKIASLSYSGDFRMAIGGEDKNKVHNIVKPNTEAFRELYESILDSQEHLFWNKSEGLFEQYLSHVTQHHHLNMLPKTVQLGLVAYRNMDGRARDTEEVLKSLAHDSRCDEIIGKCISGIVKNSSLTQSVKGIFTGGVTKSVRYGYQKLKKWWKSR